MPEEAMALCAEVCAHHLHSRRRCDTTKPDRKAGRNDQDGESVLGMVAVCTTVTVFVAPLPVPFGCSESLLLQTGAAACLVLA